MPPQKWNKPDDILKPLDDRAVDAINNNFDAVFRLLRDSPIGRGKLPVASGGTNQDTFGTGEILYAATPALIDGLPDVAVGNVLLSGGVGVAPAYGKVSLNGATIHVTGTLQPDHGGTGIGSYAIGDLLYASAATTLSKLADVATGNALISGGVTTAPAWGKVGLTTHVSGVLPIANGGTNISSYAQGDILYASAANVLSALPKSTSSTRYLSNTGSSNAPAWAQVALTTGVTGVLPEANGGTNQSTYTTGDLLYASASNTLSKLADVATGNALISGGVGVAPSWGKVGLTTHVSGTLAVGNGGTGIASFSQGDILYASASATLTALPKSTSSTRYLSNTGSSNNPAWSQVDLTNGVTGTLPIGSGGTGQTTKTAAFDALSPLTTNGDLIYFNGTNNIRLGIPAANRVLRTDGFTPSWDQVSLTAEVKNTLPVGNGGTGIASYSQGDIIYASASTTFVALPKSTSSTRYLSNTGSSNNPAWAQVALATGVSGVLPQANGGTNSTDGSVTTSTGLYDGASLRATGVAVGASGSGVEIVYSAGGLIQAFDRTGSTYQAMVLDSSACTIRGRTSGVTIRAGSADVANWDSSGNYLPITDNAYNNGDASHRWKLVRGVTITSGDLQFENRWTITEGDKIGLVTPRGLAFLDERDELVAFLARGVLYVNETRPLKELPWKKTTHAQRTLSTPSSTSASSAPSAR